MHVALSVPIQIEMFGGKLFSEIFCASKNDFFDITSSTEQLFAIPPEKLKNLGSFLKR